MNEPSTRNLRALAWITAQDGNEDTETAFAIDGTYVYRRETSLAEAVPRPRYFRAEHRQVLADDNAWDDGRAWESCTETGEPLHPTFSVRVAFEQVTVVAAPDAEAAKVKAISRLGLPHVVLRNVRAVARLLPTLVLLACAATSPDTRPPGTISERNFYPRTTYEIRQASNESSPSAQRLAPPRSDQTRVYYPRTSFERGSLSSCYFMAPCRWAASCCYDAKWRLEVPFPGWNREASDVAVRAGNR